MKSGKTPVSKRTIALLAATVLIATSGGYLGTRASLEFFSEDAKAEFELEHLQVHLIENGSDVCCGENSITSVHRHDDGAAKDEKYRGNLLEYLGYTNDTHYGSTAAYKVGTPGRVEPGRTYTEEIRAANGTGVDQYLRLTVRKYWVKDGKKFTKMDPSLIKLTYSGKAYNEGPWKINAKESTTESDTYYYTSVLGGSTGSSMNMTEPLFNELTIDSSVAEMEKNEDGTYKNVTETVTTKEDGNKITKIYSYTYDYDGCTFYIEADVQAIQTHNVNDAIASLWGVSNVSASGGKVTVK